jgi:ribosomal protein L11 methyltransferase
MGEDYWALVVCVGPEAADAVTNFLWEAGALGVVEEGCDGAATAGLRAFFPPGVAPEGTGRRLERYLGDLRGLGIPLGPGAVRLHRVADEAWADAWRAHFRPLRVGRRLLVCPPWEAAAVEGRTLVVIEPGRAFGTGGHATTRGALELLERALAVAPAPRVLDVGTGSGVLGIAAARLAPVAVTAIDLDPDAVSAATANAARNGVGDRVRVLRGGPETCAGASADLVVANLLAAGLVALAPALARCCATPGRLIAAGLLAHETPVVVASFVPEGFHLVEMVEHDGWAALLFVR